MLLGSSTLTIVSAQNMALSADAADKLFEQAMKLTQPSVLALRFRPDWALATPLFERAAIAYKHVKQFDKARRAFEKAALGSERQDSQWHAAKHLEQAAEVAKQAGDWDNCADLSKQAAVHYSEVGKSQAAAEALAKAARALEEHRPLVSCGLYKEALEVVEADGRESLAHDTYRQAIGCFIRHGQYPDAANLLLRFAVTCDASGANTSVCRAYLGTVVVLLYAKDVAGAWAAHRDALEVGAYGSSQQARAAEDLFDAYRSGDAEAIRAVAMGPIFGDLDNQVLRLARKLPQGDVAGLAASLGGAPQKPVPLSALALDNDDDLT
eukprot:jgi/Botrbrau1/1345/Bobra.0063s0056.1